MKPHAVLEKLKAKKMPLILAGLSLVAVAAGYWAGTRGAHRAPAHAANSAHEDSEETGLESSEDADEDTSEDSSEGSEEDSGGHGKHDGGPQRGHAASKSHAKEDSAEEHAAPARKSAQAPGLWKNYSQALRSIQEKMEKLQRLDLENESLKLENANLRLSLEERRFECRAEDAAKRSGEMGMKLNGETGSRMGRTLAAINYRVPSGLLPEQLYTLALKYFQGHEDEKAAVILTFLTGMEHEDAFRTAENHLMTGIAWYRLDNLSAANSYFDLVLKDTKAPKKVNEQVRLWKALVYERWGKHPEAQNWLRELLSYNPHSTEAVWINGREANSVTEHD
jgi:tetratricopeptide (TPR) repeat protein